MYSESLVEVRLTAIYLITGGCGFIGSHLCDALVDGGAQVRILDDLSTGSFNNVPKKGAVVIQASVADPAAVEAAIEGVTGCFHLAAITSVERSTQEWFESHRVNLSGTVAVLEAARRMGRPHPIPVIYASSAAIYGDCRELPIGEATPARPRSPYGADKYACELHAAIASNIHQVPTIGLRFFNIYGPRQDPRSPYAGVISIFCERLQQGRPIDIFGDGAQTRDFVFVRDAVAALQAAMRQATTQPTVFNVCSGKETSLLKLVQLIGELCGCEPQIRFHPSRAGDIVRSWGDCSRLHQRFQLPAAVELGAGLEETLSWMRGH
jgi:UDP-glucose 4-epimerase